MRSLDASTSPRPRRTRRGILRAGAAAAAAAAVLGAVGSPASATTTLGRLDFTGSGADDLAVVRNVGGGAGGTVQWYARSLSSPTLATTQWGVSTDFFLPGDYVGDGRADFAIWRPSTG
ncbi:MAG: hypothetical protein KDB35_19965, partial [Acidimicrobiales bacterium]|nr:hypothetical protein [Acidimicrobiales bacterium]